MYVRNTSFPNDTEKEGNIPENYSGYTMSMRNQPRDSAEDVNDSENMQGEEHLQETCPAENESTPALKYENTNECSHNKDTGLFSGLFEKMGIKGAESSDITVLILALLLLSGENDDYIWILLLLLLLVK